MWQSLGSTVGQCVHAAAPFAAPTTNEAIRANQALAECPHCWPTEHTAVQPEFGWFVNLVKADTGCLTEVPGVQRQTPALLPRDDGPKLLGAP